MSFKKDYDGEARAIITDAFVFTDFKPGELPDSKFFTHVAAWNTGAEHTSLSMEVIEALQLNPVGYDTIAVFGGVEKAGLWNQGDRFLILKNQHDKMLVPLQGGCLLRHLPRVLPWAMGFCPFGARLSCGA